MRRILAALLNGETGKIRPEDPLFDGIVPGPLPPLPDEENALDETSVAKMAAEYQAAKLKANEWVGKTSSENKRVLDMFCDLVGRNKPIDLVDDHDIRSFRDALQTLPPNYTKMKKFADMSLREIVKACEADGPGGGLGSGPIKLLAAGVVG